MGPARTLGSRAWPRSRSGCRRSTTFLTPIAPSRSTRRPLRDEIRERILLAWIDRGEERPSHLSVELPAQERERAPAASIQEAVRNDFVETFRSSTRFHVFTRGERREAAVAFVFLILCLLGSSVIDSVTRDDALLSGVSQGLLVLGWVAMWQPAATGVPGRVAVAEPRSLPRAVAGPDRDRVGLAGPAGTPTGSRIGSRRLSRRREPDRRASRRSRLVVDLPLEDAERGALGVGEDRDLAFAACPSGTARWRRAGLRRRPPRHGSRP